MNNPPVKIIVQNRRAHHDYFIEDSYECGIVLKERKSNQSAAAKSICRMLIVRLKTAKC